MIYEARMINYFFHCQGYHSWESKYANSWNLFRFQVLRLFVLVINFLLHIFPKYAWGQTLICLNFVPLLKLFYPIEFLIIAFLIWLLNILLKATIARHGSVIKINCFLNFQFDLHNFALNFLSDFAISQSKYSSIKSLLTASRFHFLYFPGFHLLLKQLKSLLIFFLILKSFLPRYSGPLPQFWTVILIHFKIFINFLSFIHYFISVHAPPRYLDCCFFEFQQYSIKIKEFQELLQNLLISLKFFSHL